MIDSMYGIISIYIKNPEILYSINAQVDLKENQSLSEEGRWFLLKAN